MKYLILGAGPAGLTFANRLKHNGETSYLVLEKEKTAGGLCRSVIVDGYPFDIGGGHFLDLRNLQINKFLFQFMPEIEWNKYNRDSKILLNNKIINYPIESNIWQMGLDDQIEYIKSIAQAGCNQLKAEPKKFINWIAWKLGEKIANDYMIPYNTKIFADDLNELGTYWLDKLPDVSFEDTLRSCLIKKAYGKQPGHIQFLYPKKYGYGELWRRMADHLGDQIEYNKKIKSINFKTKTVTTIDNESYRADIIITSIPWMEFEELIGIPDNIKESVKKLKYCSIETRYYNNNLDTNAQWIYYPDPELAYHRVLVRHNFCEASNGYWTETRKERVNMIPKTEHKNFHYLNEYAYPLNTIEKAEIINKLLFWTSQHRVYGLGRWGEHQHYNSDVVVDLAMKMADKLINT